MNDVREVPAPAWGPDWSRCARRTSPPERGYAGPQCVCWIGGAVNIPPKIQVPWAQAFRYAFVWALVVVATEMALVVFFEVLFHNNAAYYLMAAMVLVALAVVPLLAG